MKAIINAKVVLKDRLIEDGAILMDQGRIVVAGSKENVVIPEGCELIDAKGQYAGPGFVDIHCHAGGEYWAWQDPVKMAQFQLEGGTTSLNCTIFHDIGEEGAIDAMKKIRAAMEANTPGNIMGIHFEGPFLNPKYGANAKTIRPIVVKEYKRYLAEAADILTLWTVAPEIPLAHEFINDVHAAGIPIALGHSEASYEDVSWAAEHGASICTHLCNATGGSIMPTRYGGTREVWFDEAIMLQDGMYCEVINDSKGVHVRPMMIKLIIKTIGIDHVVGVTDACTGAVDDDDINMVNGELFGSKLRMYQVARNFKNNVGFGPVDVFRVCSNNPSKAIKLDQEVGTIEPGKRANIVICDEDYTIDKVILDGEIAINK